MSLFTRDRANDVFLEMLDLKLDAELTSNDIDTDNPTFRVIVKSYGKGLTHDSIARVMKIAVLYGGEVELAAHGGTNPLSVVWPDGARSLKAVA